MDKIRIKNGLVLINSVEAKWPCLTQKSRRYSKYSLAIELEANDASKLHRHMRSVYNDYQVKHPKSADLPFAEFSVDLGNGRMKFNLQNRQEPTLLNPDGTAFVGTIGRGSIVRLAVEAVGFANSRCGISLRVMGVEVVEAVSESTIVRELFGHPAANDVEDLDNEWDEADISKH